MSSVKADETGPDFTSLVPSEKSTIFVPSFPPSEDMVIRPDGSVAALLPNFGRAILPAPQPALPNPVPNPVLNRVPSIPGVEDEETCSIISKRLREITSESASIASGSLKIFELMNSKIDLKHDSICEGLNTAVTELTVGVDQVREGVHQLTNGHQRLDENTSKLQGIQVEVGRLVADVNDHWTSRTDALVQQFTDKFDNLFSGFTAGLTQLRLDQENLRREMNTIIVHLRAATEVAPEIPSPPTDQLAYAPVPETDHSRSGMYRDWPGKRLPNGKLDLADVSTTHCGEQEPAEYTASLKKRWPALQVWADVENDVRLPRHNDSILFANQPSIISGPQDPDLLSKMKQYQDQMDRTCCQYEVWPQRFLAFLDVDFLPVVDWARRQRPSWATLVEALLQVAEEVGNVPCPEAELVAMVRGPAETITEFTRRLIKPFYLMGMEARLNPMLFTILRQIIRRQTPTLYNRMDDFGLWKPGNNAHTVASKLLIHALSIETPDRVFHITADSSPNLASTPFSYHVDNPAALPVQGTVSPATGQRTGKMNAGSADTRRPARIPETGTNAATL